MNTRQIECFLQISENLSFVKTSEEMYISQSTVTREIQTLEEELGFRLFSRSLKTVQLTPQGKEFKKAITPLINSLNVAVTRIKNETSEYGPKIKLGFFHIASLRFIPFALHIFHERYSNVFLEIHQGTLRELETLYRTGQLDIMFAVRCIMHQKEEDHIQNIYDGTICATIPITNPLSAYESLTLDMINGFDLLILKDNASADCFTSFEKEIQKRCMDSRRIICTSTDEQEAYMRAGIGISISTGYSFIPSRQYRQVPVESELLTDLDTNYAAMWREKKETGFYIKDLMNIMNDVSSVYNSLDSLQRRYQR